MFLKKEHKDSINNENSKGPKTDPLVTPKGRGATEEENSLSYTEKLLSVEWDLNHLISHTHPQLKAVELLTLLSSFCGKARLRSTIHTEQCRDVSEHAQRHTHLLTDNKQIWVYRPSYCLWSDLNTADTLCGEVLSQFNNCGIFNSIPENRPPQLQSAVNWIWWTHAVCQSSDTLHTCII